MARPEDVIATYIRAKDGNRPHLVGRAFVPDALVRLEVKAAAIAFPGTVRGLAAIQDQLVRRFAVEFENVYTLCLARPGADARRHFSCPWLVGLAGRSDGAVRVGVGRYDWTFAAEADGRAERLVIAIETMPTLPAADAAAVFAWLDALDYPWSTPAAALAGLPNLPALAPVERFLRETAP